MKKMSNIGELLMLRRIASMSSKNRIEESWMDLIERSGPGGGRVVRCGGSERKVPADLTKTSLISFYNYEKIVYD